MILAQPAAIVTAPLNEHDVLVFLVQILLLVGMARLLGSAMRRINQPPVVGELLAGVILGPSLFGVLFTDAHLWVFGGSAAAASAVFGLAWLGVVFLLMVMGYETDLGIISRFRRVALAVAAGSLVLPMIATGAFGFVLARQLSGEAGAPQWVTASFFALALSVSALPVVGKILADLGYLRRNFGQITLAAAMAKDAVGWLILALLSGVAAGGIELDRILVSFGGLSLFVLFMLTLGKQLLDWIFRYVLARGSDTTSGFAIAVAAGIAGAAVTQALHVEAILGAYLVGLALARTRHQLPQVRDRLELVTASFFAPIFFATSGLRVDITALASVETALWTLTAIVLAIASKIAGTVISGRMAGIDYRQGLALGSGLSPLGVMGVVVAIIGLNVGVINEVAYTVLVLAAVITSLVAPMMLKWAAERLESLPEEEVRLLRETLRGDAEILAASRILLPTRGGVNSAYAAQLVAAVFPDAEVTVIAVDIPKTKRPWGWRRRGRASASDPTEVVERLGTTHARLIRKVASHPANAIIDESRLGYDLLVMGASRGEEGSAMLSTVIERVLSETGIRTMIVQSPEGRGAPSHLPRRILVPITASRSSRAAEELGYSLARASGGDAVAVHVINRPDGRGTVLGGGTIELSRSAAQAMMAEARQFAARLEVDIETAIRIAPNAEKEILDYALGVGADLLVLGTSSRPLTNQPFFGHRVSYMTEHSPLPVVIVALPSMRWVP